jgi:hypothetical protein
MPEFIVYAQETCLLSTIIEAEDEDSAKWTALNGYVDWDTDDSRDFRVNEVEPYERPRPIYIRSKFEHPRLKK